MIVIFLKFHIRFFQKNAYWSVLLSPRKKTNSATSFPHHTFIIPNLLPSLPLPPPPSPALSSTVAVTRHVATAETWLRQRVHCARNPRRRWAPRRVPRFSPDAIAVRFAAAKVEVAVSLEEVAAGSIILTSSLTNLRSTEPTCLTNCRASNLT